MYGCVCVRVYLSYRRLNNSVMWEGDCSNYYRFQFQTPFIIASAVFPFLMGTKSLDNLVYIENKQYPHNSETGQTLGHCYKYNVFPNVLVITSGVKPTTRTLCWWEVDHKFVCVCDEKWGNALNKHIGWHQVFSQPVEHMYKLKVFFPSALSLW